MPRAKFNLQEWSRPWWAASRLCFSKSICSCDYSVERRPRWCISSRWYFQTLTEAPGVFIMALMSSETGDGLTACGGRPRSSVIFLGLRTHCETAPKGIMLTPDNETKGQTQTSLCFLFSSPRLCPFHDSILWIYRPSLPIDTRKRAACGFAWEACVRVNTVAGLWFNLKDWWLETACHRQRHSSKLLSIISHLHGEQKNLLRFKALRPLNQLVRVTVASLQWFDMFWHITEEHLWV